MSELFMFLCSATNKFLFAGMYGPDIEYPSTNFFFSHILYCYVVYHFLIFFKKQQPPSEYQMVGPY